jgi:hypothetical protein
VCVCVCACVCERERESELRVVVKDTVLGNNIFGFEGSQAVPASPSGRGKAHDQD